MLESGEAEITPAVLDSIFACTLCGACDTGCKNNNGELVEPLKVLHGLRAHVVERGHALPQHAAMVRDMRDHGNAAGKPRAERSLWADKLNIVDAMHETVDVLLHIGCENAYDHRQWAELHAIVALLRRARVNFGIAGDEEAATGEGAYDLGFQDDARALAIEAALLIGRSRAQTVVTCSASSYYGFVNIWPRLGVACAAKVQHVTEFIDALFERGALAINGAFNQRVTYHDPCRLGRLGEAYVPSDAGWTTVMQAMSLPDRPTVTQFGNGGVYEPPRRLLQHVPGLSLVEMERNRVASYCCGAGGGAKQANLEFAAMAAAKRLTEAEATGATVVATACAGCRTHLGDAAAAEGRMQVLGVFEILAAATAAT